MIPLRFEPWAPCGCLVRHGSRLYARERCPFGCLGSGRAPAAPMVPEDVLDEARRVWPGCAVDVDASLDLIQVRFRGAKDLLIGGPTFGASVSLLRSHIHEAQLRRDHAC